MSGSRSGREKGWFGSLVGMLLVSLLMVGGAWAIEGDTDNDGLFDTWELAYCNTVPQCLNPNDADTDGDLRDDAFELMHGLDPLVAETIGEITLAVTANTATPYTCEADNVSFSIDTKAIGAGSGVMVAIHRDYNNNGSFDGADPAEMWPLVGEIVGDNQHYELEVFSPDSDSSQPGITTNFTGVYGSSWVEPGTYFIRVTDALNQTAVQTVYVVAPAAAPTGTVSGTVTTDGTNGVGNAVVYLMVQDGLEPDDMHPVSFAFTSDATETLGQYTINLPQEFPGTFYLTASQHGRVPSPLLSGSLTNGGGTLTGQNLILPMPTATITGTVTDYYNSTIKSANVPVFADINGREVEAWTDGDGNYTLPVLAGEPWWVEADPTPAYYAVRIANANLDWGTNLTPTTPGPNTVDLKSFRTAARFQVSAFTETSSPLPDVNVWTNLVNADWPLSSVSGSGWTDLTGQATIGVGPGEWQVATSYDGELALVGQVPQQEVVDIAANVPLSFTFYVQDGVISGYVMRSGTIAMEPAANVEVQVFTAEGFNGIPSGEPPVQAPVGALQATVWTDGSGYFEVPVLSGNWQVQAHDWQVDPNLHSQVALVTVATNGNEIVEEGETVSLADALELLYTTPWHCNNGVMDADETGIDTGGSCSGTGCTDDDDCDGVNNLSDNCPSAYNPDQFDTDLDDIGDVCDADIDGDGIDNDVDNCPNITNVDQANADFDTQGDVCDHDDDNDGLTDEWEAAYCVESVCLDPLNPDSDGDGYSDGFEISNGLDPLVFETVPALPLTITPTSAVANAVNFQIDTAAIGSGRGVSISIFRDYDNDGTFDSTDPLEGKALTVETIGDNQAFELEDFSNDEDLTDKAITTFFKGINGAGWVAPGNYFIKVTDSLGLTDPTNHVKIQMVTVIDPGTTPTGVVSGTVMDDSTTPVAVANAMVFVAASDPTDPEDMLGVGFAFTDGSGNYTVKIPDLLPDTGDFYVGAMKPGMVPSQFLFGGNLASCGTPPCSFTADRTLNNPTASITGTVTDYYSGGAVGGVPVFAYNDLTGQEVETYSNSAGNYSLPVIDGQEWFVEADPTPQFFAVRTGSHLDWGAPVTAPALVDFKAFKTIARIQVSAVEEDGTTPVSDADVWANPDNAPEPLYNINSSGVTEIFPHPLAGRASLGVDKGTWNVSVNAGGQPLVAQAQQQAIVDLGDSVPLTFTFYRQDGTISGNVKQSDGTTNAVDVDVEAFTPQGYNGTTPTGVGALQAGGWTDESGSFTLPVLSGDWQVQAHDWNNNLHSAVVTVSVATNGNEIVEGGEAVSIEQTLILDQSTSWHCDNTVQDADETGLNCGGSSCAPCPIDTDGDGYFDFLDNCPTVANADQANDDGDSFGNACDFCPLDLQNDIDGDGFCGDVDPYPYDTDNDGYDNDLDCNNADASINPGATELPGDGIDSNCDGQEICYVDADDDGYRSIDQTFLSMDVDCADAGEAYADDPQDCDDNNLAINPGATEVCGDGLDNNCMNGVDDGCVFDNDLDGYSSDVDCNDSNASIHPGATEIAGNDVDEDCNGYVACYDDTDSDGYGSSGVWQNAFTAVNSSSQTAAVCDSSTADAFDGSSDDNCPTMFNPDQIDSDIDGIGDVCDACPLDALNDADNDGVCANVDNCPESPNADQLNGDGDAEGDVCDNDLDNDLVLNAYDNCDIVANADQTDTDLDGLGDACDADDDNDAILDLSDNCPLTANADQTDTDQDGFGDACDADDDNDAFLDVSDNCPLTANADQTDTDQDGLGDACDADDDNDTVLDLSDNCPLVANAGQENIDNDGLGDICDPDDDNDAVLDLADNCAAVANADQADTDLDGTGDACDTDDDNDAILDLTDNCPLVANPGQEDYDNNNLGDACDPCPAGSLRLNDVCVACPSGTYQSLTDQTSCIDALPGYFAAGPGATEPTQCAPGTYQPNPGADSCIDAQVGHYVSAPAQTTQLACTPGYYQDQAGQPFCDPAPLGTFVNSEGASTPTTCTFGTYQNQTGQTSCLPAPVGAYVGTEGAETYTYCAAGTYQPNTGAFQCLPADPGYFVADTGMSNQEACAAETYQDLPGQVSCSACPTGTSQPLTGQATCAADTDDDGVLDDSDNCPLVTNPLQENFDGDLLGDACDGDDDNDGLPNQWEITYGLNPHDATGANGATGDQDGDGILNLEEYQRGSDPRFNSIYPITTSSRPVGNITPSTTVKHGDDLVVTIEPVAGYIIDWVVVDGQQIAGPFTSPYDYTFTDVTGGHSITAGFKVASIPITASARTGGSISPAGTTQVANGADQPFTITANAGYVINWIVVDGQYLTSPFASPYDYTFTNVTSGHSITAGFKVAGYPINASAGNGGGITPSGTTQVVSGADQTYTVTADAGYTIDSVVVDGQQVAGPFTSPYDYTFTGVTSGHSITAGFKMANIPITASARTGGTISPAGTTQVANGANQTFTITADAGYAIDWIVVDGQQVAGPFTSPYDYTFTNVTSGHAITASFEAASMPITASARAGGSISPAGTTQVANGADQTFTITADGGYAIDWIVVNGQQVAGPFTSPYDYTFTNVTSGHSITAGFKAANIPINAAARPGGTISPAGTTYLASGAEQTYTITASPAYSIDWIVVDGQQVAGPFTSPYDYTFTNVTGGHSITAGFKLTSMPINASARSGGSITSPGLNYYPVGSDQTYTITANGGYTIDWVWVDGYYLAGPFGNTYDHTFTNLNAGHSITAGFRIP